MSTQTILTGKAAHNARPNRESSGSHLHLDHLTPKSKGGADVATNLVLACRSCNSRRQDKSLTEWAESAPQLTFTARSIRAQARRKLPA